MPVMHRLALTFRTRRSGLLVSAAALFGILSAITAANAQGPRVSYTPAQAERGATLYAASCAACHAADLTGSATVPPLKGTEFEGYWLGKQVGELFEKVSVTMPKTMPGSLTPAQSADLVAYVLRETKVPAGTTELGSNMDELNKLKIEAQK
jgi:S-disulfanyl-L-cysteine oxidoreductase SoxD